MGLQYSIVHVVAQSVRDAVATARASYPGGLEYSAAVELAQAVKL